MTSDLNKNIELISYNNLNLPVQIIIYINGKKHSIDYIYAASGEKRGKIITDSEGVKTTTDYLQGFQYKQEVLQFFPHAEGYVAVVDGKNFQYAYNYADHLGNVRLSYGADPANGQAVVLEENHYYPFGLKHRNYNAQQFEYAENENGVSVVLEEVQRKEYQYKYNGKELQDELGLNLYDYGARNYDPAIGRWMNIDPLAEVSRRWSPYNYAYNNPIIFVDPDGMLATYNWDGPNKGQYTDNGTVVSFGEAMASYGLNSNGEPKIIKRKEWGAKSPITKGREWEKIHTNLSVYYNTITVHHSGNEDNELTIQELQDKEQESGYADIPYHFAIDGEGNIYEGRPLNIKGSHVKGSNSGNIGIVLLADLDSKDRGLNVLFKAIEKVTGDGEASTEMIQSLFNLTQYLKSTYGIQYFGGHQEAIPSRYCPGDMGMEWVKNIRQSFKMQEPIKK